MISTFMETYNKTLSEKVKQQQRRVTIVQKFQPPKISDMFLASSVLANHLKKDKNPNDKVTNGNTNNSGNGNSSGNANNTVTEPHGKKN